MGLGFRPVFATASSEAALAARKTSFFVWPFLFRAT
jgi:hypothetical protein